jgi:pyruvate/2-oxoglutarate dehydrogenase complex dihydrolipoamide acyltransferase (E2) component
MPDNSSDVKVGKLIGILVEKGDDWKNVEVPKEEEKPSEKKKVETKAKEEKPKSEKQQQKQQPEQSQYILFHIKN